MPFRAPSICAQCGAVHKDGQLCARAATMIRERKAKAEAKRPSARQRGYSAEWEREARAFLAQPENRECARCGAPATVVMHIKSIRTRPDLRMDRTNWRPGCHRCNAFEAAEERRGEKGN